VHTAPTISVIVPALNEAANLPHVLPRIPADVYEVISVDGHSTDDTVVVARELLPNVRVVEQDGRGKGAALRTGLRRSPRRHHRDARRGRLDCARGDPLVRPRADRRRRHGQGVPVRGRWRYERHARLYGTGFEIETMLGVRALKLGLKVAEVPSFESPRIHGVSNLRTIPDGWRVLKTIVKERFTSHGFVRQADVAEVADTREVVPIP
jgi:hypothetical protein